jgi:hypothetical protein
MRPITCKIYQNNGTITPGSLYAVTSGSIEDLADKSQQVDGKNNLTKVTPGDIVVKVIDPTGSIWAFLTTQLTLIPGITAWLPGTTYAVGTSVVANGQAYTCKVAGTSSVTGTGPTGTATSGITDGTCQWGYVQNSGLLPPWIEVFVGGTREFLGNVDPARVVLHQSADDDSIEIAAFDWSMALSNTYLGAPTGSPWVPSYQYVKGVDCINGGSSFTCIQGGISAAAGGPVGIGSSITDGTVIWAFLTPSWMRTIPPLALAPASSSANGWSQDSANSLSRGLYTNMIFVNNPCAWIAPSTVLTMSQPILTLNELRALPSQGYLVGDRISDGTQWWIYAITFGSIMLGNAQYGFLPCAAPAITDPYFALPNATLFPAPPSGQPGLIITIPGTGTYQLNTTGTAWGAAAPVPVWPSALHPAYFSVVANTPNNSLCPANTTGWEGAAMIQLNGLPWPATGLGGTWNATFTQSGATLQDVEYWTTTVAVGGGSNCYTLPLNSVAGILPGDKLHTLSGGSSAGSWTVAGVDPTLFQVTTVEQVQNVPLGTQIFFDTDSDNEMTLQDPGIILSQAAFPFTVDLSLFSAPNTQDPVFGLIGSPYLANNANSPAIYGIGDIEPTLSGLKLSTGAYWLDPNSPGNYLKTLTYTGTPGAWAYTSTTPVVYTPNADWTQQLAAAPSSLMPYEVSLNPFMRLRNRVYNDNSYYQENNGLIVVNNLVVNGAYVQTLANGSYQYTQTGLTYSTSNGDNFTPWTPTMGVSAQALPVYDYLNMRRLLFNGSALEVRPWNGTAWGTATFTGSWPGGRYVQSAVPMVGGGAPAGSILAITTLSGVQNLDLWGLSGGLLNTVCTVPPALIGGVLQTTPYATYLVGPQVIGLVTFVAGALVITPQYLSGSVTWLWGNTLVARTPTEIMIFGRFDDYSSGSMVTETWAFRLNSTFSLGAGLNTSVLWSELIQQGCPTLMGVTRDPSKPGRLVGHLSGTLFQVDTQVPMTLDRFTPGGMTAMELIEHICQLYNALAIPDANGTLHIISRVQNDTPLALTVSQVTVDSTLSWPDFASIVRVGSNDGTYYSDAYGQQGGVLLEVSDHPLCASQSNCMAMAQGLIGWFGQPRLLTRQTWFWTNPDTAPPWEAVPLWTKVTVNGGPPCRIVQMDQNYIDGTATVTTVGA